MSRAYLLDTDRTTLAPLDASYQSLTTTRRYWGTDVFKMVIDRRRAYADQIAEGRFLYLPDEDEIYLIEQMVNERTGSADNLIVSGRGIDGIATEERLIIPDGTAYDEQFSVEAESAMKSYVDRHAGPTADAARQIPGLVCATDTASGSLISFAGRFGTIADALLAIGLISGLGWEITYDPTANEFVFDIITGVDRTGTVFFDFKFETLEAWSEMVSLIDSKTWVLVAGQGEGTLRDLVERWQGSEPTGFNRREAFVDARDVTLGESTQLENRGDAFLVENGPERRYEAEVHQYGSFRYRTHWDLGDVVLIRDALRGLSHDARVVEVVSEWQQSAVAPTIKAVLDRPFPDLPERVRQAARGETPIVDQPV